MSADFEKRLARVQTVSKRYDTQKAFSDAIGMSESRVSKALSERTSTERKLAPIEAELTVRNLWGDEPAEAEVKSVDSPALSADENGGVVPTGYTRVPEILIEPSAAEVWDVGTEEDIVPEEQPSDTIFPDWYIRSEYGVSPERIRFVRVRGDSMLPTIAPGQRLVVALLQPGTTLRDSAIYILVGPGGAQVKRLIMEPDHIHVWSDNPDRPRFKVRLATFSKDYTVVAVVLEANLKL